MAKVFGEVHPDKDLDKVWAKTFAAREHVETRQWAIVDMVPPEDFKFVQVNQMMAKDGGTYVAMEREVYKPVHQALVEDGVTAGWGLYWLVSPHGTSQPYNYGTADFLHSLEGINWGEYVRKAHPDEDVDSLLAGQGDVRAMVNSEIWELVDRTTPAE